MPQTAGMHAPAAIVTNGVASSSFRPATETVALRRGGCGANSGGRSVHAAGVRNRTTGMRIRPSAGCLCPARVRPRV